PLVNVHTLPTRRARDDALELGIAQQVSLAILDQQSRDVAIPREMLGLEREGQCPGSVRAREGPSRLKPERCQRRRRFPSPLSRKRLAARGGSGGPAMGNRSLGAGRKLLQDPEHLSSGCGAGPRVLG